MKASGVISVSTKCYGTRTWTIPPISARPRVELAKNVAQIQSHVEGFPTVDECVAQVRRIVASHTGRPGRLPDAVVQFYAAETRQMIEKFRDDRDAGDDIGDKVTACR